MNVRWKSAARYSYAAILSHATVSVVFEATLDPWQMAGVVEIAVLEVINSVATSLQAEPDSNSGLGKDLVRQTEIYRTISLSRTLWPAITHRID